MSKRVPTLQLDGTLLEKFMPAYLKAAVIALKADKAITITAGTGLTGGGDLSANRTLAVAYGTSAGTAAQGNDSRLSDARVPTVHNHPLTDLPTAWVKQTARVATTANITLSGTQIIDGIAVAVGDRVLVKNQTATATNGLYTVASGAWARSADADTPAELASAAVAVQDGTQAGLWATTLKSSAVLGTTAMSWFPITDAASGLATKADKATTITVGTGLTGGGDLSANRTIAITFGTTAGTVTQGNDSRLSDARTPTAHSHLIADLPVAASGASSSTQLVRADDSRLSDTRVPKTHTHPTSDIVNLDTTLTAKADKATTITAGTGLSGGGDLSTSRTLAVQYGSTAGTAAQGNDARLSDARTPTAHTHPLTDLPSAWVKDAVRVASTGNVASLSGLPTIDGVPLVAGDRVLLKDQTTANQNGIYTAAAGAWSRAADANTAAECAGAVVAVLSGNTQAGLKYSTNFASTSTLGTTPMAWVAEVTKTNPTLDGIVSLGSSDTDFTMDRTLHLDTHARSVTTTYTGGLLTQIVEKAGTTTMLTTTLNYDTNNVLTSVVEVANGKTVTTTMNYDTSGVFTGTTRSVA